MYIKCKMKKQILWIIAILILSASAIAGNETIVCSDNIMINQNCTFITPPLNCGTPSYLVLNSSGEVIMNDSLISLSNSVYQFNFTLTNETRDYVILLCDGTFREVHVTNGEEGNMILAALTIVPMLLAIVLVFANLGLGDEHKVLKIFFLMFSLICFFVSMAIGGIGISIYFSNPAIIDFITTAMWIFGGVFIAIMSYFILYTIYVVTMSVWKDRQDKLEY